MNIFAASSVLALATLAGCAPRVEGAYTDPQGTPAFRLAHGKYFRAGPDGSDFRTRGHAPRAHPYKLAGRTLIVEQGPDRTEFELLDDGRLKLARDGQAQIFVRK